MNKKIRNILLKKGKTKIVSLTAYSKSIAKIQILCRYSFSRDSIANVFMDTKIHIKLI